MRRDALRRAAAPVRPALTLLCLLPLCLSLMACGEAAPSAAPIAPEPPPAPAKPIDPPPAQDAEPPAQDAEIVLASADDVRLFNAQGDAHAGLVRITGDVPSTVSLPHLREAEAILVDRPNRLQALNLQALERAGEVTVAGPLQALTLPRLAHLRVLDLEDAGALQGLTLPELTALDELAATVVPAARWRLPALKWLGHLSWTGGPADAPPHWLALEAWQAGEGLWIHTGAQAQLFAPALDRLGALSVKAPAGSRAKMEALREVTGDVRWAVPDFAPGALAGIDGDLLIEAGATEWPALQVVAGDLHVFGKHVTGVFLPALMAVGGQVSIQDASVSEVVWSRLRWVGDVLPDDVGPALQIQGCPDLHLVAFDDLARVRADADGVAVHIAANPRLCTPPRFGAVPAEAVRYEAACGR